MDKYKLLVVDDERIIREGILSFGWENLGFDAVHAAANGEEAINYINKENVDVILTDIKMPVIDGLELCTYVSNYHPSCKIIILTGYKDFEYAKRAISTGVFEYILKPVDMDEINRVFSSLKIELDKQKIQFSDISQEYSLAVRNAIICMEEHYSKKISLDFIAKKVFLSSGYLSTHFTKETGKTLICCDLCQ